MDTIESESTNKTEQTSIVGPVNLEFTGDHLFSSLSFPASCQEYFDLGNRVNGKFKIRPDQKYHAFDVECEFDDDGVITILKSNQWTAKGYTFPPTEDQRCSEANCFTHNFEYSVSNDQIKVQFKIYYKKMLSPHDELILHVK